MATNQRGAGQDRLTPGTNPVSSVALRLIEKKDHLGWNQEGLKCSIQGHALHRGDYNFVAPVMGLLDSEPNGKKKLGTLQPTRSGTSVSG